MTPLHPPIYYMIRSVVRLVFWASLFGGIMYLTVELGFREPTDPCPITFNTDFTYTTTQWYPGMQCSLPRNIAVDANGNWWWAN